MIDLHCHILPGVDDGSDSPDMSCRMAAAAADCGVRYIFATPHCNTRDARKNFRSEALLQAYRDLQAELDRWQIPIRILPGAEVLVRGDFEEYLAKDRFMTLNGSRYLLVEFYFDEDADFMEHSLRAVEEAGLVPVVAHPERYFAVQNNPGIAGAWRERGRLLQLNKGSLLGELGDAAWDAASLLLRRGLYSVAASDAHHFYYRNPDFRPLLELLEDRFPEADPEELLWTNPRKIAKNHPV